jgi:hypothetical protein
LVGDSVRVKNETMNTTSFTTVLLSCIFAVSASACLPPIEPDDDGGDGDDSSEPLPEETCNLTYHNSIYDNGPVDIHYLYLWPDGSTDLGPDFLGDSILTYGERFTLADVPLGIYNTSVVDEDRYFYVHVVECDGSDWTWTITVEDVAGQLEG